jgi:transcription initiation factor TFIIIB Brf1 subunit/transcription initiation factor TFIIB
MEIVPLSSLPLPETSSNIKNHKTQKKKKPLSTIEKERWWKLLDDEKEQLKTEQNISDPIQSEVRELDLCPVCTNVLIFMEEGFPACTFCGYMNNYSLDYSPEWRYFASDQKGTQADTTRCGNPIDPLLEESSYACKIICTSHASYEMKNLRKWARWQSMPHREKALYDEFQIITIMAQNAGIPKTFIELAKSIYKDLYEQKTFRGVKRDAIRAASIWISCWKYGYPRTSNEIADIFKIDRTSASLGCSLAEEMLHSHERNMEQSDKSQLCPLTPSSFIERFSSKLGFTAELTILAKFVAHQVEKQNTILDNRPQAIAAGILYFISFHCQLQFSKMDIKNILGDEASEVTINKCFKKLNEFKSVLLPSWVFSQ